MTGIVCSHETPLVWKEYVLELIDKARWMIVLLGSSTEGLLRESKQALIDHLLDDIPNNDLPEYLYVLLVITPLRKKHGGRIHWSYYLLNTGLAASLLNGLLIVAVAVSTLGLVLYIVLF